MSRNIGIIDRVVRIIAAAGIIGLIQAGILTGTLATLFAVLSGVLIATVVMGSCPAYRLVKLSTLGKQS